MKTSIQGLFYVANCTVEFKVFENYFASVFNNKIVLIVFKLYGIKEINEHYFKAIFDII